MSLVAAHLQLEQAAVEDYLLDGDQVDQLSAFFEASGPKAVMFFYQEADTPIPSWLGEGGRGYNIFILLVRTYIYKLYTMCAYVC